MVVTVPPSLGAPRLPTRGAFENLARREDVPGAQGLLETKFLMTGVRTPQPALYFMNTNRFSYHYDFAVAALGERRPVEEFNRVTYFSDQRENLAGTVLAHDRFGDGAGLYTVEFWPTDPVAADFVGVAVSAITDAMPFAGPNFAYHPAGETQEALLERDRARLAQFGVRIVTTDDLFGNLAYSPLNLGVGFGLLRLVTAAQPRPPSARDVVVLESLPNDLSHVAGVLSETPQTPLSHVNLKAKQNNTPNAYVRGARSRPEVAAALGKLVRYEAAADGFTIREATAAEVDEHLARLRPPVGQRPTQDLTVTGIASLDTLGHASSDAFGAKAANVAELRRILPAAMVPDGFAVPFSFYVGFMQANGLDRAATELSSDAEFRADAEARDEALTSLRTRVRAAPIPTPLADAIRARHAAAPPDVALRCRSSTNNEDLRGFNGAGLYDSYTHRPDEGDLGGTIQQVWASLWNYRAFEERDFWRIDHLALAMGVLVHPNYDDETANGVAVTKNIYDPRLRGFYVNVQVGESLVTNPEPAAVPDEFLVAALGEHGEYETQYIRHSNLTGGKDVMTPAQVAELVGAMERIHDHFQEIYRHQGDTAFAMDIEFKVTAGGALIVKQARPWVD